MLMNKSLRRTLANEAGVTVMEMLGVLIVVGILGTMGAYGFSKLTEWLDETRYMDDVKYIISGVKSQYRSQPANTRYGTAVISSSSLINAKAAPDGAISGTSLVNPFSGQYVVTGANSTFYVDGDNIPKESCIAILTKLSSGSFTSAVQVAATQASVASATSTAVPVSLTTADGACATALNAIRLTAK